MPRDLPQALDMRGRYPEATPIAGGTDLCVHWPQRAAEEPEPRTWLDLSSVDELRTCRWTDDELTLGARATYWDVIRDRRAADELPLLVQAARLVGAMQIQTRGTWGGNIVNASPAADGVPVLMAYGATVVLASRHQTVELPLSDFYLGYKEMRMQPDQLLTEIRVPRVPYDFQWFEKVGSRSAQAITKVGVAVTRRGDAWRVVANSVAPTVCRCRAVETLLATGGTVSGPDDLMVTLQQDVSPIDDVRSTARYRDGCWPACCTGDCATNATHSPDPTETMPDLSFTLNGVPVNVAYEDGMNLLDVLRDECNVTSPKDGCAPQGGMWLLHHHGRRKGCPELPAAAGVDRGQAGHHARRNSRSQAAGARRRVRSRGGASVWILHPGDRGPRSGAAGPQSRGR